jgi:hypothetical protein
MGQHANYTDQATAAAGLSGQRKGSPRQLISVFYFGDATILPSNSSIIFKRLGGLRLDPLLLR